MYNINSSCEGENVNGIFVMMKISVTYVLISASAFNMVSKFHRK